MIKIINGVFGLKKDDSVIPKTSKDDPFSCDPKVEERLVNLGVAEYVKSKDRPSLIQEYKRLGLKGNPTQMKNAALEKAIADFKTAEPKEEDVPNEDENNSDVEDENNNDVDETSNSDDEEEPNLSETDGVE